MKRKLTKKFVESLAPAERDYIVWDAELKGFGVKVTPQGKKVYFLYYRAKGRQRRPIVGEHGKSGHGLTCERARMVAGTWIAQVRAGGDPSADRQAERRAVEADGNTVGAMLDEFEKRHISKLRPSTQREMKRHAKRVRDAWDARPIASITRRDVIAFIDGHGGTVNANRALTVVKTFMRWAVRRDMIPFNPAADVDKPADEKSRDRVLTPDEVRAIWTACDTLTGPLAPLGPITRFLLLTAQRRSPVQLMRWCDVDEVEKVWRIPGEFQKSGRSHDVPLSEAALDIACAQRAAQRERREASAGTEVADCPWVFATAAGLPFHGFSKTKRALDATSGTKGWRLHDLRRTAAAGMASLGVSRVAIGKVLDHAEAGVTAIYDRYSYGDEKRAALDAWAKRVADILATEPGKVVELRRAG